VNKRHVSLFVTLACLACVTERISGQTPATAGTTENVILVTLDGARTQEIFGGLNEDILASTLKEDQKLEAQPAYTRFWAPTREERRQKLMPFLWQLVTTDGSIAGDRSVESVVQLRNRLWFSYPGYAEILLGEPHDEEIKSNDPLRNPYTTVLERLRERLSLPSEKVATFASWSVFNAIAEHAEGSTVVNAGIEPVDSPDPDVRLIDGLQGEAKPPWGGIRHDAFTFRLAMHTSGRCASAGVVHCVRRDRRLGARRPLRSRARRVCPHRRLPARTVGMGAGAARVSWAHTPPHHDGSRSWKDAG